MYIYLYIYFPLGPEAENDENLPHPGKVGLCSQDCIDCGFRFSKIMLIKVSYSFRLPSRQ